MGNSEVNSLSPGDLILEESCPGCLGKRFRSLSGRDFLSCCFDCGLVFDNPRPNWQAIAAFYGQSGKYDHWLANLALRERLWRRRLRKMRRQSESGSLLDIGTGIAQFLSLAASYSPVVGTEVSTLAVEIAFQRYGIRVLEGEIESLTFAQKFDNITCFHVLEHVRQPAVFLAKCRQLLARNGRLFIAVPNDLGTPKARLRKGCLQPISLSSEEIHLSHFTPKSLHSVLERAGFSVMDISLDPYWASSGWKEPLRYYTMRLLHAVSKMNLYPTIWAVATPM